MNIKNINSNKNEKNSVIYIEKAVKYILFTGTVFLIIRYGRLTSGCVISDKDNTKLAFVISIAMAIIDIVTPNVINEDDSFI
uniref:Uncharacterized protein n=1 Tax=Megaviridae environmental sample TaxID=1737588 RepID=A0A5J6VKC9_9VIRU|nr:MAG: hypothetical protein [Megaviridae environmental sample]